MDTFLLEYFLKRMLRLSEPTVGCRRHVYRRKFEDNVLTIERSTGQWFRMCAKCKCRHVYSRMVRCSECQWYVHEGCAYGAAAHEEDQKHLTDRVRSVQAFTETRKLATAVMRDSATDEKDENSATADLVDELLFWLLRFPT